MCELSSYQTYEPYNGNFRRCECFFNIYIYMDNAFIERNSHLKAWFKNWRKDVGGSRVLFYYFGRSETLFL